MPCKVFERGSLECIGLVQWACLVLAWLGEGAFRCLMLAIELLRVGSRLRVPFVAAWLVMHFISLLVPFGA